MLTNSQTSPPEIYEYSHPLWSQQVQSISSSHQMQTELFLFTDEFIFSLNSLSKLEFNGRTQRAKNPLDIRKSHQRVLSALDDFFFNQTSVCLL